jgi:nitrite reductase/ring-hydroxylating ferredoxin subunit
MPPFALRRRDILVVGGAATLFSATGCAILRGGAVHPLYAKSDAALKDGVLRVPLADLAALKPGEVLEVHPGKPYGHVLIAPDGKGGWLAAKARCPHKGCIVDFDPKVSEWQCPCHDSRFDTSGKFLDGPDGVGPLATLAPQVDADALALDLAPALEK